jgi:small subunit ribosomal protein S18
MDDTKNPTSSEAPAPRSSSGPGERSDRGERPQRGNGPRRGGRFSGPRPPRACPFCVQKVDYIDFKAVDLLRRYLTDRGKIKARRKVGTCAKHQRRVAVAIKRARHVALLPFSTENARD